MSLGWCHKRQAPALELGEGLFYNPEAFVRFIRNLSRRRWWRLVISALAWPNCFEETLVDFRR